MDNQSARPQPLTADELTTLRDMIERNLNEGLSGRESDRFDRLTDGDVPNSYGPLLATIDALQSAQPPAGKVDVETLAAIVDPEAFNLDSKIHARPSRQHVAREIAIRLIASGLVSTPLAAQPTQREQLLRNALVDMHAGWKYIRQHHGDLSGVGWDRCDKSATVALALGRTPAVAELESKP